MKLRHSVLAAIALLSMAIAHAQVGDNGNKHYEKDGLAFDYPAEWKLLENTEQSTQTVTIRPDGSQAEITVRLENRPVQSCDFQAEAKKIAKGLTEQLAMRMNTGAAARTSPAKTQIGDTELNGTELHGLINHNRATGSVYSLRLNRRFVSLVYVRADDDKRASSAWNTVRTTLKVEPAVMTVLGTKTVDNSEAAITSGVLNGRAIRLPAPNYPPIARQAHASGTVSVQVTIDEAGNVISANAIEGHPLLRAACVIAARGAQFSPTKLCDEPVRVTGVITYNFVNQ